MERKYDVNKLKEFISDVNNAYGEYTVNYDYAVYNEMGNEDSVNTILDALFKLDDNFLIHPEDYQKEISIFGRKLEDFLL